MSRAPSLPAAGPVTAALLDLLRAEPAGTGPADPPVVAVLDAVRTLPGGTGLLADLDAQRAWYLLAELSGRGVDGVADDWAEHPGVAAVRLALGDRLEAALRERVGSCEPCAPTELVEVLRAGIRSVESPALSVRLAERGTAEEYRSLLRHRSAYHLREADPHTWGIPRLHGRAQAALVEIQADEYGGGDPEWVHSALFARAMRAFGLDDSYGAYLADLPTVTLAWANAMTLFASRRRLRGALVGHLVALEASSALPMRRYGDGLRRLGLGANATAFFDEHIEADAVHEQVAYFDLAVPFAESEPDLVADVLFGFRAALELDADLFRELEREWDGPGQDGPGQDGPGQDGPARARRGV